MNKLKIKFELRNSIVDLPIDKLYCTMDAKKL